MDDDPRVAAALSHAPARGRLSAEQLDHLLRPIDRQRLGNLQGKSHLKAWDVRRWLIRIFGFGGWDQKIRDTALVAEWETDEEKPVYENGQRTDRTKTVHYWHAIYRAAVRLDIFDPEGLLAATYEEVATCDAKGPSRGDVHDQALKGAASQALKRCAVNLGDQFGLSLYNSGSVNPVIERVLVGYPPTGQPTGPPVGANDGPVGDEHDPTVDREPSTQDRPDDPSAGQPAPPAAAPPVGTDQSQPAQQRQRPPLLPPRNASRQQRDEAAVIVGASEAAAIRGDRAFVERAWRQAKETGVLDVALTQLDPSDPATVEQALIMYGEQATARRGSAHTDPPPAREPGQPAPDFADWSGAR